MGKTLTEGSFINPVRWMHQ